MAFEEGFLDELKSRIRVADVVGRRVKLTRKGREFMGLCPFHSEKSPSFSVNEQKGFYHCFGCGAHGDAIKFVCETEGLTFREAVERLAGEAGLDVPQQSREAQAREERRRTLHDVVALAQAFYRERLAGPGGAAARAYLSKRELDGKTIERFGLGFAPDGRTTLIQHLTQKGVALAEIIEAGLAVVPEGHSEPIDFFRTRLTIPISDVRGRVVAFGARTLLPDGKPKYINTSETPLFHKGRTLYNLDKARKPAFDAQTILVAEGYLDVIALAKAGFENAVAPLGTALTEDQIQLLWRIAPEPVLCFDGDTAGKRAASRALDRALPLLKAGQSLRFAFLPEGLDPDDLIKRDGAGAMQDVLKAAQPLIQVFWERERDAADLSTPERRAALEKRVGEAVAAIADPSVREHYARDMKERLWGLFRPQKAARPAGRPVPAKSGIGGAAAQRPSLRRAAQQAGARGRRPEPGPVYGQNPPGLRSGGGRGKVSKIEAELAFLLTRYPGIVMQDYETVERLTLSAPRLEQLRVETLHYAVENPVLDVGGLKSHLGKAGLLEALSGLENTGLLALDSTDSADVSPDQVLVRWREAVASHRRVHELGPAARRARGEWAREANDGARRSLDEIEAVLKRHLDHAADDTGAND